VLMRQVEVWRRSSAGAATGGRPGSIHFVSNSSCHCACSQRSSYSCSFSSCSRGSLFSCSRCCFFSSNSASVVRDLGIYIDSDVSMRSHIAKTVRACFATLRQLRSIHRSVPRSVLQSLMSSLVLSQLDYGNGSLVGIPLCQLEGLQ